MSGGRLFHDLRLNISTSVKFLSVGLVDIEPKAGAKQFQRLW